MINSDDILIEIRSKFCTLSFQLFQQYARGKNWKLIIKELKNYQKTYHNISSNLSQKEKYNKLKAINVNLASLWWRFVWEMTGTAGNTETARHSQSGYVNHLKDLISWFDRTLAVTIFPLIRPQYIEPEHTQLIELEFIELFFPINLILIAKFRLMSSKLGLDIWQALNLLKSIKINLLPVLHSIYRQTPMKDSRTFILDQIKITLEIAEKKSITYPNKQKITSLLPKRSHTTLQDEFLFEIPDQYHKYFKEQYFHHQIDQFVEVIRKQGNLIHDHVPKYQQLAGYQGLKKTITQIELADYHQSGIISLTEIPFSTSKYRGRMDQLIFFNLQFDNEFLPVFLGILERKTKTQLKINLNKFVTKKSTTKLAIGVHYKIHPLSTTDLINLAESLVHDNYVKQQLKIYSNHILKQLIELVGHKHPSYSTIYKHHQPLRLISVIASSSDYLDLAKAEYDIILSFIHNLSSIPLKLLQSPLLLSHPEYESIVILLLPYNGSGHLLKSTPQPVPQTLKTMYQSLTSSKGSRLDLNITLIYAVAGKHQSGLKAALQSTIMYIIQAIESDNSSGNNNNNNNNNTLLLDISNSLVKFNDSKCYLWGVEIPFPTLSVDLLSKSPNTINYIQQELHNYNTVIVTGIHLIRSYQNLTVPKIENVIVSLLPKSATIYWIDTPTPSIGFSSAYWSSTYLLFPTTKDGKIFSNLAGKLVKIIWNFPTPVHSAANLQPLSNQHRILVTHSPKLDKYSTRIYKFPILASLSKSYHQSGKYDYLEDRIENKEQTVKNALELLPWLINKDPVEFQPVDISYHSIKDKKPTPFVSRLFYDSDLPIHGNSSALSLTENDDDTTLYAYESRSSRIIKSAKVKNIYDPPYLFELIVPDLNQQDSQDLVYKILTKEIKQFNKIVKQLKKIDSPTLKLLSLINILEQSIPTITHAQHIQTLKQQIILWNNNINQNNKSKNELSWSSFDYLLHQIKEKLQQDFPTIKTLLDFSPGLWLCILVSGIANQYQVPSSHINSLLSRYSTWIYYLIGYTLTRSDYTYSLTVLFQQLESECRQAEIDNLQLVDLGQLLPVKILTYSNSYIFLIDVSQSFSTKFRSEFKIVWFITSRSKQLQNLFSSSILFSSQFLLKYVEFNNPEQITSSFIMIKDRSWILYLPDQDSFHAISQLRPIYSTTDSNQISVLYLTPTEKHEISSSVIETLEITDSSHDFDEFLDELQEREEELSYCEVKVVVTIDQDLYFVKLFDSKSDLSDEADCLDFLEFTNTTDLLNFLRLCRSGFYLDPENQIKYHWYINDIIYDPEELSCLQLFVNLSSKQYNTILSTSNILPIFDTPDEFYEYQSTPTQSTLDIQIDHDTVLCRNLHLLSISQPKILEVPYSTQLQNGQVHDLCFVVKNPPTILLKLFNQSISSDQLLLSADQVYQLFHSTTFWDTNSGIFYVLSITTSNWAVFREHPLLIKLYHQYIDPTHPPMTFGSFSLSQYIEITTISFSKSFLCVDIIYHNHQTGKDYHIDYPQATRCQMSVTVLHQFSFEKKLCYGLDWEKIINPDLIEEFEEEINEFISKHQITCNCFDATNNISNHQQDADFLPQFVELYIDEDDQYNQIVYILELLIEDPLPNYTLLSSSDKSDIFDTLIKLLCSFVFIDTDILDFDDITLSGESDEFLEDVKGLLVDTVESPLDNKLSEVLNQINSLNHSIKLLETSMSCYLSTLREFCQSIIKSQLTKFPDPPKQGCLYHYKCESTSHHLLSGFSGVDLQLCNETLHLLLWLDLLDKSDEFTSNKEIIQITDKSTREEKLQYYQLLLIHNYYSLNSEGRFQLLYEIGSRQIRFDPILARSYLLAADQIYKNEFDGYQKDEYIYTSPDTAPYPALEASKLNVMYNIGRAYEAEAENITTFIERKLLLRKAKDKYLNTIDELENIKQILTKPQISSDLFQIYNRLSIVYYWLEEYEDCLRMLQLKLPLSNKNKFENLLFQFQVYLVNNNFEKLDKLVIDIETFYANSNKMENERYSLLLADSLFLQGKLRHAMSNILKLTSSNNPYVRAFSLKRRIQILIVQNSPYHKSLQKLRNMENMATGRLLVSIKTYLIEIDLLEEIVNSSYYNVEKIYEEIDTKEISSKLKNYISLLISHFETSNFETSDNIMRHAHLLSDPSLSKTLRILQIIVLSDY